MQNNNGIQEYYQIQRVIASLRTQASKMLRIGDISQASKLTREANDMEMSLLKSANQKLSEFTQVEALVTKSYQ